MFSNPRETDIVFVGSRNGVQAVAILRLLSSSTFSGFICIVSSTSFRSSKITFHCFRH